MAEYTFEVADWCKTVAKETPPLTIPADDDGMALGILALAFNGLDSWGRISDSSAASAWEDGETVAAWNIPHPKHGNYQARLRRG